MGRSQRTKGQVWERAVAIMFRRFLRGCDAKRGLQCRGGAAVSDVDVPAFWVECKHGRTVNIRGALRQAVRDMGKRSGLYPVAIVKDHGGESYAVMRLGDWFGLVGEWWDRGLR